MASPLLRIGQVAQRAGVSTDTIRYYERLGLLPKPHRTLAGYREYSENTVNRITLVRNAMRFGFSLREISGFLRVREAGGKPCHQVRHAAQIILDRVDQQIVELTSTRETMRETLLKWDAQLARTPAKLPARLLEGLPSDSHRSSRRPLKH
jgi:MerR family transcriptional regulator, Zn(II)-responsive regulator of zntA